MNGWRQNKFLKRVPRKRIAIWQLLVLLVLGTLCSLFFLRQNNIKMVELRNLVLQADEQQGDISGAIKALNEHVFSHMNTEIVRPIELVHSYNLQAQAVLVAASKGSGRDVYAEATAACERQGVAPTTIAQCAANYALQNNPGIDPTAIKLPEKDQFTYSFAAPRWTPDIAGFSLLLTGIILLWFTARLVEYIGVRMLLRHRAKNAFY
jgi:hypothetical protein